MQPGPVEGIPPYALWGLIILLLGGVTAATWNLIRNIFNKNDERYDYLEGQVINNEKLATDKLNAFKDEFNNFRLKHIEDTATAQLANNERLSKMEAKIIEEIHKVGDESTQIFATKTELKETKEELKAAINER